MEWATPKRDSDMLRQTAEMRMANDEDSMESFEREIEFLMETPRHARVMHFLGAQSACCITTRHR